MRLRLGIGQRLTIWWVALFALGLVLFSLLSAAWVEHAHQRALSVDLMEQAGEGLAAVDRRSGRLVRGVPIPAVPGYALAVYVEGRLSDLRGARPRAAVLARAATLPGGRMGSIGGDPDYLAAVADAVDGSGIRVVVFVENEPLEDEEGRVRAALFAAGLPIMIFAGFTGWLLARGALAPIARITAAASDVARSGRLDARLRLESDDELGRLAQTFDEMLARLQASFERERAFIGDVSHELRQPLAAIGAEAELTLLREREPAEYARALEAIRERSERLTSTIDDLLLLARADAGVVGREPRGEANEAASGACAELQRRGAGIPVELRLSEEPLNVAVGTTLLTRMVENLVANARRAARSLVRVEVVSSGERASIIVDDDGPGVPHEEREAIFRRFYRRAQTRGDGTGLGLPIAAAIARAAGGEIRVDERPGGGARFVVTLPIAG
ncbi:MAG: HAMP domain-containing histidine kinase [bacterium]|nr:HAMP domain-containing histidine kinase [bacterium]